MLEKLTPLVGGQEALIGRCQIFSERPHLTWDNFFSGDVIFDWIAGQRGFGVTMTRQPHWLPSVVRKDYFHFKKTPADARSRVARFNPPIAAVKQVLFDINETTHKPYKRVHVSFQYTSSTNISTVNALNSNMLFVFKKERGIGVDKKKWGIEMNNARLLYLKTYGQIDTMDQLIGHCNMYNRSWKYWHAAKNHAMALAIVVAYEMYLECAQGELRQEWKIDRKKIMDFHTFRERLLFQGLQYFPVNG